MSLEDLIHNGRKTAKRLLCAGLAATTLFLTACPPTNLIDSLSEPAENELSENTKILPPEKLAQISSTGEGYIEFNSSQSYSSGDIIVADISPSTPEGLLRKITSVSGNIVYTQPASLEEAVKNANLTTQRTVSRADARSFSFINGVSESVNSKSLVDFNLNIDVDVGNGVSIDGNLKFNSDLFLEIGIENSHLAKLLFKNVTTEESGLQLTALAPLENIIDKEFPLANYNFTPFTLFLPTVPPFPIVITPKLEVLAGVEGGVSPITVGATQYLNSELGLKYENGSWDIIKSVTSSYSFTPVEFADAFNLKVYAGPKINFLLYGVAGPYAEINGDLSLELSTAGDSIEVYGGLEAILGVNMKIFSKTLFDFSTNLLDFKWLLGRWQKGVKPEPTSSTLTDTRDGKVYKTIKIGDQWWMAENLNAGVMVIQGNGTPRQYNNGIIEKTCYNNDPTSGNIYGGLYTWDEMMQYAPSDNGAVGTTRGIAPLGWHIPTDEEWKTLERFLGMSSSQVNLTGLRGNSEGGKLKKIGTSYWISPNEGATNESGFTALPGGEADYQRGNYSTGLFEDMGEEATFWTATQTLMYPSFAWSHNLYYDSSRISKYDIQKFRALSVRCVKD